MIERFFSYRRAVHLDQLEPGVFYGKKVLFDSDMECPIPIGKTVVANGCFDVPHPGHLSLIEHLWCTGVQMNLMPILAINSDESVRRLKGPTRPAWPAEARAAFLTKLQWPLTVIVFDEDSPQRLMDLLQPQVVVKGSEYDPETVIRWHGSQVVSCPMVGGWSTTNILRDR